MFGELWPQLKNEVKFDVYSELYSAKQMFAQLRTGVKPSWKYSSKLYSGSKKLRSTCSGNIRHIRRSLPLTGWEQSSPVDEEKIKIKMDDGVARFSTRFGGNLFICWHFITLRTGLRPSIFNCDWKPPRIFLLIRYKLTPNESPITRWKVPVA